jgi:Tol biopolymer transport system component
VTARQCPVACISLILLSASVALGGITQRISVGPGGVQGDGDSWPSQISADGRYVVFVSDATNLVPGDTNGWPDVFVRVLATEQTIRVSVAGDGSQGNDESGGAAISTDGRYVVFHSWATNLVAGDTNSACDVFLRDLQAETTTRVSLATDGTQGNGDSKFPTVSADGRYVAFESAAGNLVAGDTNGFIDIFLRDLDTPVTTRVSVATGGAQGQGESYLGYISANGEYVVFTSEAGNLVAGDTNGWADVFVRDVVGAETTRVSVHTDGTQGDDESYVASISADGRYVGFSSYATNLVDGYAGPWSQAYVRDRQANETELVSIAEGGTPGDWNSEFPYVSSDGHYVVFESTASNLVSGDTNDFRDIFVHDRVTGATERESASTDGSQADADCWVPSISDDGSYVVFDSTASNLVPDDTNDVSDVFFRDRWAVTLSLSGANGRVTVNTVTHALPWSGEFSMGGSVTLEAVGDECWDFEEWTGDLTGTENPVTIVMDADKDIGVAFTSGIIFDDIGCDHQFFNEIGACYGAGIVAGYGDGNYYAEWTVTRDQMAVFLVRALGEEPTSPADPQSWLDAYGYDPENPDTWVVDFSDVPSSGWLGGEGPHWAWYHIQRLYEVGVTEGISLTEYGPDQDVLRDQMAVFLVRALGLECSNPCDDIACWGYDPAEPSTWAYAFDDVPPTGEDTCTGAFWAWFHIQALYDTGVTLGCDESNYCPADSVLRGQMAAFLARAFLGP